MDQPVIYLLDKQTIIVLIAVFGLIAFYYISHKKKNDEKINKLTEYSINVSTVVDENTPDLINLIIEDCWTEHLAMNPKILDSDFIREESETDLIKEVSEMVIRRMSPVIVSKLSTFYNVNQLPDIITRKTYLHISSFTANFNTPKDEVRKENQIIM